MASKHKKRAFQLALILSLAFLYACIDISEASDSTTQQTSNPSNGGIPSAALIQTDDPRYPSFKLLDDLIMSSMDTSISPCDDFYGYTCGKSIEDGATGPVAQSEKFSTAKQLANLKNDTFFERAILPLKQLKHLFDRCVNPDATKEEVSHLIKRKINTLKSLSGVEFPLMYQKEQTKLLTPEQLGKLIGYSQSDADISSIVAVTVEQDAKQPDKISASIYVDQVALFERGDILNISEVRASCESIAAHLEVNLDAAQLENDIMEMVELENMWIASYQMDVKTRRNKSRGYNSQSIQVLQDAAPAFNWIELIRATFKSSTLANYVHYRAISATIDFIAKVVPNHLAVSDATKNIKLGKREIARHNKWAEPVNTITAEKQQTCLKLAMRKMKEAGNRFFADSVYPTPESRVALSTKMMEMTKSIFNGFRTQIDMLNWMSPESKIAAYDKLENMLVTIGFPDWVTKDDLLIEYYKDLTFTENSSTLEVFASVDNFTLTKKVENFRLQNASLRRSVSAVTGYANAQYSPSANAIFIYGGFMNSPVYDPSFPMAFNLGGLGAVIGHELVHGYDDGGVQFDRIGALNPWLDENSTAGFSAMAKCVIDQYAAYCPVIGSKKFCLHGYDTQGENIADNGGLQAAYKAFKAYEALNGPDPRLPSFGKVFNSDQLFFLGFGNLHCGAKESDEKLIEQIATDPHSPSEYRALGPLQNFPAFRAAFNCPVGSAYAPQSHCDVWTAFRKPSP